MRNKPTYYIWRSDYTSQQEFESERDKYTRSGFRVVSFLDGSKEDIHTGFKALVKNHWSDKS